MLMSRDKVTVESGKGISIRWDGVEITAGSGLRCLFRRGIAWYDSSQGSVGDCAVKDGRMTFTVRIGAVTQAWTLELKEDNCIGWTVECEVSDGVPVEEFRFLCSVKNVYKSWVCDYLQGDFRRSNQEWDELLPEPAAATLVGLRFPCGGLEVPAMAMEPGATLQGPVFPIVQASPAQEAVQVFGLNVLTDMLPGTGLSLRICLLPGAGIDEKMELRRTASVARLLNGAPVVKRGLKVLLLNLPWKRGEVWGVRAGSRWPHIKSQAEEGYLPFPFFLAYGAALLRKNGIQAQLIDAIAEQIPVKELLDKIAASKAHLIVVETSTPSFEDDMECMRSIAALRIPIAVCGPHAPMYDTEFLARNSFLQYVMCGEYEETMLELTKFLQTGIPPLAGIRGLIWWDGDKPVKNAGREPGDINRLPWPVRDSLPMHRYLDAPGEMPLPSVQMTASRGCPFRCIFCLWPQVMFKSRNYRSRYVPDVLDEMEFLVKEKGYRSVYFDDDTFNVGKDRMLEFCRGLTERGLHHTPWAIMARPDLMDEEILDAMKAAGLWAVKYGVESADQALLDGIRKNMDLKRTIRMVEYTNRLGIRTHLTFTFGLPGETLKTIDATIALACRLNPFSVQFSITTPFPETEFFSAMEREGKIISRNWSEYDGNSAGVVQASALTAEQLIGAQAKAYRVWTDHCRRRRGFLGDAARFIAYCRSKGIVSGMAKTADYLRFVFFRRTHYLRGE